MREKTTIEQFKILHQAFVNLWGAMAEATFFPELLPEIADVLAGWLERIQLCFRRLIARR